MMDSLNELVQSLREASERRFTESFDRCFFAPPAVEDEIHELERMIAGKLPDEYRSFLRLVRRIETDHLSFLSPLQIAMIYRGIETPTRLITGSPDRPAEDEVIPIAEDGGGDMFLLGIRGPNAGRIWFWSHESEEPVHGSASEGYEESAPSFAAFIAAVRDQWLRDAK